MRKLAIFVALAGLAFATAPPAVAAVASPAFGNPARSGELCPSVVAIVANDVAPAAIVAPVPHRRASASVQPRLFAAALIVGFGFAAAPFSPGAPAPLDPGRLSIA
jgi:hypothetical protein